MVASHWLGWGGGVDRKNVSSRGWNSKSGVHLQGRVCARLSPCLSVGAAVGMVGLKVVPGRLGSPSPGGPQRLSVLSQESIQGQTRHNG